MAERKFDDKVIPWIASSKSCDQKLLDYLEVIIYLLPHYVDCNPYCQSKTHINYRIINFWIIIDLLLH